MYIIHTLCIIPTHYILYIQYILYTHNTYCILYTRYIWNTQYCLISRLRTLAAAQLLQAEDALLFHLQPAEAPSPEGGVVVHQTAHPHLGLRAGAGLALGPAPILLRGHAPLLPALIIVLQRANQKPVPQWGSICNCIHSSIWSSVHVCVVCRPWLVVEG